MAVHAVIFVANAYHHPAKYSMKVNWMLQYVPWGVPPEGHRAPPRVSQNAGVCENLPEALCFRRPSCRLTTNLTIKTGQRFQVFPFVIHGWVHIAVHGDFHIGMSEYFAKRLHVHPAFDAARGKCVAQHMEFPMAYFCFLEHLFEAVL